MVWISDGTYLNCNTASPYLASDALARAGVVVVSAHYRTGAEGFAHLDDAPDNHGPVSRGAIAEDLAGPAVRRP